MKDKKYLDFLASLLLLALGGYVVLYSLFITVKTNSKWITSPGFLPGLLGAGLVLCSILLMAESLKGVGLAKTITLLKDWWNECLHSQQTRNTLFGMLLMGIYTCVLMTLLPYWLATLIMLLFLFWYLRAGSAVKSILIAVFAVVMIVGVFQYAFHVRLP